MTRAAGLVSQASRALAPLVAAVLLSAAGCGAGIGASGADTTGGAGTGAVTGTGGFALPPGTGGTGGGNRAGTGGTGTGGGGAVAGTGGAGGTAFGTGGSGGAPASPGADAGVSRDAGGGGDAAGMPPANTCRVNIAAVSPGQLNDLPASPGSRLRVRGTLMGSPLPPVPAWRWVVTFLGDSSAVPHAPVGGDPTEIQFAVERVGSYRIEASVSTTCSGVAFASAVPPGSRTVNYWIRTTPPPMGAAGSLASAPPKEATLPVMAGRPSMYDVVLDPGYEVQIDPQITDPQTNAPVAVRSYIRVSAAKSSVRIEGVNGSAPFRTLLQPTTIYDVLVVPEQAVAPLLFRGSAADIRTYPFVLDGATAVTGTVTIGAATGPVQGARVLLRSPGLPSTVGDCCDASGKFRLLVREGTFSAVVLPPAGSVLPEAQVQGALSLSDRAPLLVGLDFAWRPIATVGLTVSVQAADGAVPARPVRVRVETETGGLPGVGTLTASAGGSPVVFQAAGYFRAEAVTNSAGAVAFPSLPRARYRLTLVPGDDGAGSAVTTLPLDLSAPGPSVVDRAASLLRKVKVQGRLVAADSGGAAGTRLVAIDSGADLAGATVSATLGADGSYTLALDPGRAYRLFAEPAATQAMPRIPLGSFTAPMADATMENRTLPKSLSVTGTVTLERKNVAGAVVQAYCVGPPPDCVDLSAPSTDLARPLSETVTGASGGYVLQVPDPGTAF